MSLSFLYFTEDANSSHIKYMNKKVFGRKLSRSRPAREALFASLAKALILNGKIVTTRAKAKAVVPEVEKMITLAKKADIQARRKVFGMLDNSKEGVKFLFDIVAKSFSNKKSGFTRIISLPRRHGDNAEMARLEWTEKMVTEDVKNKDKKNESKTEVKKENTTKKAKKDSSLKSSNPKS